ncbi:aspartate aminotransferase family protein [Streptomyces huiliensis]|uniref:aspartate aminotransferase family protein n=1 Tax=Streptomyces huiliensis TaxID=2876027 RepID=UPI001CBA6E4A|nr:aminotransferase class III-fold pyridoxal phosphate-dependent enzyme [Streptomyces huiliensis]
MTAVPDRSAVHDVYRRHLSAGRARLSSMLGGALELGGDGCWVYDDAGTRYLDCGGYGVFLLGHRHPEVVAAVHAQLDRHPMATRLLLEPVAAAAAGELASVAPPGLTRVHFANSGAEATETALKLARAAGCGALVSAHQGFHGKTSGALALTARPLYQEPFRPLLPGVHHVTYGDAAALDALLAELPERACVFLEPVQGEAGVVLPEPGYLARVAEVCRARGALLAVDEIQTGMGRLGTWWGADRDGVSPDLMLVGKGLSGGVVPVAAVLATDEVYRPFSADPFLHSSTFAASPLAMAAAEAAVRVTRDEDVVARTAATGGLLLAAVREALEPYRDGVVADVRGTGLLIGVEFATEAAAGEFTLHMLEQHILVNHSLNSGRVIRLTPSYLLTESDVARIAAVCGEAAAHVAARLVPAHPVPSPLNGAQA